MNKCQQNKQWYIDSLIWKVPGVVENRSSTISLFVFRRKIHISFSISCIIQFPTCYWCTSYSYLQYQSEWIELRVCSFHTKIGSCRYHLHHQKVLFERNARSILRVPLFCSHYATQHFKMVCMIMRNYAKWCKQISYEYRIFTERNGKRCTRSKIVLTAFLLQVREISYEYHFCLPLEARQT